MEDVLEKSLHLATVVKGSKNKKKSLGIGYCLLELALTALKIGGISNKNGCIHHARELEKCCCCTADAIEHAGLHHRCVLLVLVVGRRE